MKSKSDENGAVTMTGTPMSKGWYSPVLDQLELGFEPKHWSSGIQT